MVIFSRCAQQHTSRLIIIISKFIKGHVCLQKAAEALVRCRSDGLVAAIKQECLRTTLKHCTLKLSRPTCRNSEIDKWQYSDYFVIL